jgi:hypothetical protein
MMDQFVGWTSRHKNSPKYSPCTIPQEFSKRELGYGLDTDSKSWVQFCLPDSRYCVDKCFFLSTSNGRAFHVDLRMKGLVSFVEKLSEKKVNTLR